MWNREATPHVEHNHRWVRLRVRAPGGCRRLPAAHRPPDVRRLRPAQSVRAQGTSPALCGCLARPQSRGVGARRTHETAEMRGAGGLGLGLGGTGVAFRLTVTRRLRGWLQSPARPRPAAQGERRADVRHGADGVARLRPDAAGHAVGTSHRRRQPQPGREPHPSGAQRDPVGRLVSRSPGAAVRSVDRRRWTVRQQRAPLRCADLLGAVLRSASPVHCSPKGPTTRA